MLKNLRSIRLSNNLTTSQVAEKIGVSLRTYQNYENGSTEMPFELMKKLADFFHCSVDYLLGRQFNETPAQQNLVQIVRTLDDDLCDLAEAYIEGLKATQQQRDRIRERAIRASSSSQEE